jgi:hypothetical protein
MAAAHRYQHVADLRPKQKTRAAANANRVAGMAGRATTAAAGREAGAEPPIPLCMHAGSVKRTKPCPSIPACLAAMWPRHHCRHFAQ